MANQANTAAYRLPDGRMAVNVDTNKTLTISDSGYVQNVIADNVVVTLPATATHGTFIVRNGGVPVTNGTAGSGADFTAKVSVSPNSADKIQGGVGGSEVDDKDLINTKATARVGDEVTVENRAETNGPIVTAIKGIWAREA